MFTGIVQGTGKVLQVKPGGLELFLPRNLRVKKGGSLAVNGICLTVRTVKDGKAVFDCMPETLRRTTLGDLQAGDRLNLETPLTLQTLVGGHLVQGHVDGVGTITSVRHEGNSRWLRIRIPKPLCGYLVKKGSVAVDGVSLTIAEVHRDGCSVSLIPETLRRTTLGRKKAGERVNIEVDLVAKYIKSLLKSSMQK